MRDITNLDDLILHAAEAEIVTWQGSRALRLVNGLALIRDLTAADARIDVEIRTDGAAYPGIVFRAADRANYELGYAQPHTSGQWDVIQYDPVFHGSNTWQIYFGPAYQKSAVVPTGEWFRLRVDVKGEQAAFAINDQPPLIVPRLMHHSAAGHIGVWTYLPAYFRDLRVADCPALPQGTVEQPQRPDGAVDEWFIEGFGRAVCEPNGTLNLNRYLPASLGETVLTRQFETTSNEPVTLLVGFSDALVLQLDGETLFEGQCTFANLNSYASRGYVEPGPPLTQVVAPGIHTLSARLKVTEGFGWGLAVALQGPAVTLLPVIS